MICFKSNKNKKCPETVGQLTGLDEHWLWRKETVLWVGDSWSVWSSAGEGDEAARAPGPGVGAEHLGTGSAAHSLQQEGRGLTFRQLKEPHICRPAHICRSGLPLDTFSTPVPAGKAAAMQECPTSGMCGGELPNTSPQGGCRCRLSAGPGFCKDLAGI